MPKIHPIEDAWPKIYGKFWSKVSMQCTTQIGHNKSYDTISHMSFSFVYNWVHRAVSRIEELFIFYGPLSLNLQQRLLLFKQPSL